jgi:hypothetical protein
MPLIDAYRRDTGVKVKVPAHWLDHPTLGKPFARTPTQKARDTQAAAPTTAPTKAPAAGDKKE